MATDREMFLAMVFSGPLLQADAIVLLAGEDTPARAKTAVELFRSGAAPVIVATGGRHEPPRHQSAEHIAPEFLGGGVAPDRIFFEDKSLNTAQQAVNVVGIVKAQKWKRVLLVVSPYHLPRAFLTFLTALQRAHLAETVRLVPVPANNPMWSTPAWQGGESRLALFDDELEKCERYLGDVATFAEGIAYLNWWDGR